MKKSLVLSIIFMGDSLNYGENGELKKITKGNGEVYTLVSKECLGYCMRMNGIKNFGWNLTPLVKDGGDTAVVQYDPNVSLKDSQEKDLFGFMVTKKASKKKKDDGSEENVKGGSSTRTAVIRVTDAISLVPYAYDSNFLTNGSFASRAGCFSNITNFEKHKCLYTYSVVIDLDRVGVDEETGETLLSKEEKAIRVNEALEVIKSLYREVKGHTVNLSPLFVAGGLSPICNNVLLDRLVLDVDINKNFILKTKPIQDSLEFEFKDICMKDVYKVGLIEGILGNDEEIKSLFGQTYSIQQFFKDLESQVTDYYTK